MQANLNIGTTLSVSPDLAREAGRRRFKQPFRVLNLLQHLRQSQGDTTSFILWQDAIELLQLLGWSQSSAYRLLQEGMGVLWHKVKRNQRRYPGQKGIRLTGAQKLAEAWGIKKLANYKVEVPIETVLPPKERGKHTGVAISNAVMFHTQLPGPGHLRLSNKNGKTRIRRPKPGHPISRQALESQTGVSRRSQHRYDKLRINRAVVTKKRPNYVEGQLAEVQGKDRTYRIPRRLGNSYTSTLNRSTFGQAHVYNTAGDGHLAHSAEGPFSPVRNRQRYFETAKSYQRSRSRLMDEPLIRSKFNARYQTWEHLEDAPPIHRYDDAIPTFS